MREKAMNNTVYIGGIKYAIIKYSDLKKLEKAKKNLEYLEEIDRRFAEIEAGHYEEHDLIEVE